MSERKYVKLFEDFVNNDESKQINEKKDDPPTLDTFKRMAKEADDIDQLMSDIRKIDNVPAEVSDEFFNKYGKDGDLSPREAIKNLFNEVKGKNK